MSKLMLWISVGLFGTVASFIPHMFGWDDLLWAVLFSTVGGVIGIWAWYRWLRFV